MHSIRCLIAVLAVTLSGTAALADNDPPKCTITRIKTTDVSIDVPLRGNLVSELHCHNDAKKAAKDYAREHQVCDPKKKLEKTFPFSLEFGTRAAPKKKTVMASCP
jgi:hypothetical protein